MNAIKNNFWFSQEGGQILAEFVLFAVQIVAVVFLLNLAVGRYSGDVEIKFSELTTASDHQNNIKEEKNRLGSTIGEDSKVILSSVSF